jgi:hypothetical protein
MLPQVKLFWNGVRGLPPALPLVEDVTLLILTPLIVLVRTGFKERNSYTKFLLSCKFLKSRSFSKTPIFDKNQRWKGFPQKFLTPSLGTGKRAPAF